MAPFSYMVLTTVMCAVIAHRRVTKNRVGFSHVVVSHDTRVRTGRKNTPGLSQLFSTFLKTSKVLKVYPLKIRAKGVSVRIGMPSFLGGVLMRIGSPFCKTRERICGLWVCQWG